MSHKKDQSKHKKVHKKEPKLKHELEHKLESMPLTLLNQIKCEFLPLTEHSLFEHSHFLDVERHIHVLASQRKMDVHIALCIAYFHDISRIKEGINGKLHAKRSAEIANKRLKKISNVKLSKSTRKVICSAILHHNQKAKIHGPFDELIKDADSLAHQDEFGFPSDSDFEQIRLDLMALDQVNFSVSKVIDIQSVYTMYSEAFLALFKSTPKDMNHWVHEIRIAIRKLRALLYFNDNTTLKRETFSALKPIFKVLSKSRALYVLYKSLESFESLEGIRNALEKILKEENHKIMEYLKGHQSGEFITGLEQLLTANKSHLSFQDAALSRLIKRYFKYLNSATLKDKETLHRLRIEGKQLKYLMGSGLIEMTHPIFQETLLSLHDLLGDLNDLQDQALFFKHYKMSAEERQLLMNHISDQTHFLEKEIKKRLFLLKKMIRLNKIIL
ncbi:CHAD domain-containing protein [Fusibacter ferrireducens]|uniref:CHAD domain-containing protein n=1 Tax=Fusibacter ferrireducens TaxID=2785058 RepID=A0ABR9ZNB4_9FIRM|nr:CHAD domain-containing protein [Fusibacter ferrireducens]MBF4691806.1 CHAD domain-containing protein [Fusibacter ferrireducens]